MTTRHATTHSHRDTRDTRDQGFTLIELLVVVIIVGVLAAIAIPVFLNQRKKAIDASLKSDLKNAATTAETIATDTPELTAYPAGALTTAGFKPSPGNSIRVLGGPSGGYCLLAYNPNASTAYNGQPNDATSMFYDSREGGIAPACTLTGNYVLP